MLSNTSACTSAEDGPDPLSALAESARADAEQARAIFAAHQGLSGAKVVAQARGEQATALRREVDREAGETETTATRSPGRPAVPQDSGSASEQLVRRLRTAQRDAAELVPTLPRYRAGLVGSVSAGCASLLEAL